MKSSKGRGQLDVVLDPPATVRAIARRLERAGFETWCVGGAVRDALLGQKNLDWDLATAATPPQIRRLFRRTIPVGVQFGTIGVLDTEGTMHEVTTFRRDVQTDGRHAVVEFGASLDEDLARRDFTINAIAFSPSSGRLHDPFGGRDDLDRRILRAVGDPQERMREDRLRSLRAIRFAARFGFGIEDATWTAIVDSAPHLGRLSAERVKQELEKTMEQVPRPSEALEQWRSSGAMTTLLPELASSSALTFAAADHLPRPTLPGRPQRLINRLCAILLDLSPAEAERVLRRLRFSNAQVAWCRALVQSWRGTGVAMHAALLAADPSDLTLRRWVAAVGRVSMPALVRLLLARAQAGRAAGLEAPGQARLRAVYRRTLRTAFREPVELSDLAVDGDDLRRQGIPAGPEMGHTLQALLDWVLEDPGRNTHTELLAKVAEIVQQRHRDNAQES
jgi:tRNA nucleotidyltransferase (CCA-adding enzyme)